MLKPLQIKGKRFQDPDGWAVILRGVNVGSLLKITFELKEKKFPIVIPTNEIISGRYRI